LIATAKTRLVPVYVVLPQQTMLLDVAGPLEVVRAAQREQAPVQFEVRYVGPAPEVSTSIGLIIAEIEPLPQRLPDGAMVIVSGMVEYAMTSGGEEGQRRSGAGDAEIVAWLRGVSGLAIRWLRSALVRCWPDVLVFWMGGLARRIMHVARSWQSWRRLRGCWRTDFMLRMVSVIRALALHRESI
jgi:hypothetical protein